MRLSSPRSSTASSRESRRGEIDHPTDVASAIGGRKPSTRSWKRHSRPRHISGIFRIRADRIESESGRSRSRGSVPGPQSDNTTASCSRYLVSRHSAGLIPMSGKGQQLRPRSSSSTRSFGNAGFSRSKSQPRHVAAKQRRCSRRGPAPPNRTVIPFAFNSGTSATVGGLCHGAERPVRNTNSRSYAQPGGTLE